MPFAGLAGKVAIVTGGGSGIGAAAALRLSREGSSVVVVDAKADAAERVAAELPGPGLAVAADVSSEDDVGRYMRAALERFGRVDLYHLNAGIAGTPAPIPDIEAAEFDRVLAVHARGMFLGLRAAFRQYRAQGGGGAVVTTASLAGLRGAADIVPYHVAKHAVVGLTQCAAVYGGPLGIRVNAVAPGIIPTGLLAGPGADPAALRDAAERAWNSTPLGRMGTPEEVAALVAFLLSDDAAYVSGGVHAVDGAAGATNPFRPAWMENRPAFDWSGP
jgi:NAD(P)-dependent dehydrogenase (short-subunit alcohol dehydrogenase family)